MIFRALGRRDDQGGAVRVCFQNRTRPRRESFGLPARSRVRSIAEAT
jgi:hypothetical protein